MSQNPSDGTTLLDPFGLWKQTRDANLEVWSKFMIDLVNSDAYAQMSGTALSQALGASQPFRKALEQVMTMALESMNMPTRREVISIAEREVNMEMRLDDLDAKLSTVQKALVATLREAVQEVVQTAVKEAVQQVVKDAVRQALTTPTRHLREIDARLAAIDAKLQALQPVPAAAPTEKAQEA